MRKRKTTRSLVVPSDVPQALEALGVPVERLRGNEADARCPMHKERTGKPDKSPSWGVNVDTGLHSCFSCGYSGNFVGLVMDLTDLDSSAAVAWIQSQGRRRRVAKEPAEDPKPAPLDEFVDPPTKALLKRKLVPTSVAHYGVRWDTKKPAWIIPIRGPNGKYRGYQRKDRHGVLNVPPGLRKQDTYFGVERFTGYRAILVESPLDVVRLHSAGLEGGLALFGSSMSKEQEKLLVRTLEVETVVVAFDNDDAGRAASRRIAESDHRFGRDVRTYFFRYPDHGKDPGDLETSEIWAGVTQAQYFTEYQQRGRHTQW